MHRALGVILIMISAVAYSSDEITEDDALELLKKEKAYAQAQNLAAFESLLTDDAEVVFKDKVKVSKSEYLIFLARSLMNADKILYKPELLSFKQRDDLISAEIYVRQVEKYLYVRGHGQTVRSNTNVSRAIIVLENGAAKYKYAEHVRSE